ncbi:MAG TPA: M48 family metalloprotease, partial [Anaerolineales bacterium]|nr:M48 family metalloprotease [Anaerolineales bacterium]
LFLIGLATVWVYITIINRSSLGRYTQVTQVSHPDLYRMVTGIQQKWRIQKLDIYLNPTNNLNASASDFGSRFIIVNQGLWSSIQGEAHRRFVIGHEMGHIGLGHSWLNVLAYQADNAFQYSWFGLAFNFLLLNYSRKKELSADRIGLLTCGSLQAALETLAFLELHRQNPTYQDVQQAVTHLTQTKGNLEVNLAELFSTHPDAYERAQELVKFAKQVGIS